jgi:gluconolactonase
MYKDIQNFIRTLLLSVCLTSQFIFAQELILVDNGFQFTEGPVWKDGSLYFSDIQGDKIYRWCADSGTTVFRDPSGRSNGLTLDLDGNIIIAGHSARHVARLETKDSITIIASHYDGKKFNSPNDIVVKSDGSIFFTDPTYGLNDIGGTPDLDFCGIYRISPAGEVQLLDATLSAPNGICFSPDESLLYVSESNPFVRKIFVWDVFDDSTITNKREFAHISTPNCYLDGMKVDENGRLYSCGILGVVVFEPDGTPVDTINVPGSTTNCNWGDEDGKMLYITSGDAVYKYKKNISGFFETDKNFLKSFHLNNYPNPFNPLTTIEFEISKSEFLELNVFDLSGKKVSTLVSKRLSPGKYAYKFDGNSLPSGVYFYQIIMNNLREVGKMTLIK